MIRVLIILFITGCQPTQPLLRSNHDTKKVLNKITITDSDSVQINIYYYWNMPNDTVRIDTVKFINYE